MKSYTWVACLSLCAVGIVRSAPAYPIVDTNQTRCYDTRMAIPPPQPGEAFYGQDAQFSTNPPAYENPKDGTVIDRVTRLMWTADPGAKLTYDEALAGAVKCRVGGYEDWRMPTIKELYSLIQFNGTDPDPQSEDTARLVPFMDRTFFKFEYGNPDRGERVIDSQFATSTLYKSTTMGGNKTVFGVNFADGRIKGYPTGRTRSGELKTFHVLYVRGNPNYGVNRFKDAGDGTVLDEATGLVWMKADAGKAMDWQTALQYACDLKLAGHSDWRLPNAKELQSLVDYSRSPDTSGSAAIDPLFEVTGIRNEDGTPDFPSYWSSTSHLRGNGSEAAVYVAFGRSLGWMQDRRSGKRQLMDVHGAGSQRSDPKAGSASRFPYGRGPQGDVIRIQNAVRCVRGGNVTKATSEP